MSKFYKSLGELAMPYGSSSEYGQKYHNLTKAQKALTSAQAQSRLTLEDKDKTQPDIDSSDVIFTVFARIATCSGTLPFIVNFGPCREASKAYLEFFGSRAGGFLQVSCRSLYSCEADYSQKMVFDLTGTRVVPLTKIY
jgi:hypothetical protein